MNKTIGIIGGGQLGKMLSIAATTMGFKTIIYSNVTDFPAKKFCDEYFISDFNDQVIIDQFIAKCDYVTYEFENIFHSVLSKFKGKINPNIDFLYITQNRIREKQYINNLGIKTADFYVFPGEYYIDKPHILKTTELGYDGKGQWKVSSNEEIESIISNENLQEAIIEKIVDFDLEVSVMAARDSFGNIEIFEPTENFHKDGILDKSVIPANINKELKDQLISTSKKIIDSSNYIGCLAIEYFVKGNQFFVNELAPRPHNSYHWTLDAAQNSQFIQHIRCISGLPVANAKTLSKVTMINLIGDDINNNSYHLDKNAKIHIYGKSSVRNGRKMGHVNILG